MPSHTSGKVMPGFLGGSDLAVPVGADKALGEDWIADFTDTAAMKGLQAKGNIPNTTSLFNRVEASTSGLRVAQLVRPDREELGQRRERRTSSARCSPRS